MRPRRYAKIAALSKLRRPVVAAVVSDGCHGQTSERSRIPAFLRTSAEAGKLHDHARRGGRAARYRRARAEEARRSYRCNAGDRELHRAVRHHARRTLLARADRRRGPHLRAITATKKERTLPPSITFNGKPYQWTKTLPDDVRGALFEAFTSGESVKRFIAMPKDTARCALTIARLERETGAVYADPHLEELARRDREKRRGVETRCLNVATAPCMTPAQAGVALAGDVHPDAPEKPHLCVPQALTQPSRKAHPGSWRPSPKRPGCPHRHFPQILTHAPRKGSPAAPAGAHQPFPEGSPRVPVSAHQALPYRLTPTFPEKLTDSSRKISPFGQVRIFEGGMRR